MDIINTQKWKSHQNTATTKGSRLIWGDFFLFLKKSFINLNNILRFIKLYLNNFSVIIKTVKQTE